MNDIDPLCKESFLALKSSRFGTINYKNFTFSYYIQKRFYFINILTITAVENRSNTIDCEGIIQEILLKEGDVDYIAQPLASGFMLSCPSGSSLKQFGTFEINLNQNQEELLSKMHSKHRNVVNRAMKLDYRFNSTEKFDVVYRILFETMKRQGKKTFSRSYLEGVCKISKCYSIYINDQIQGVAVVPYSKIKAYYLHGGSAENVETGALNLLHFEIMKDMKKIGVEVYDLMGARSAVEKGSKIEGIQRFKERFGGEKVMGFIWKKAITKKGMIFQILLRLRRLISSGKFKADLIDE